MHFTINTHQLNIIDVQRNMLHLAQIQENLITKLCS